MLSDIEADNLPAVVREDEHHEQEPEGRRGHDKHVDGSDAECLVAQKAAPGRRWRVRPAHHVLGYGCLTDLDTELEQLTVDARRTQSGLAKHISRISLRVWPDIGLRPDRDRQRQ